ncbi:MAG TPA: AAA family ATPase [Streptosporangiaceae bacterium]|nr:AAA family ATPase [Streptosporangiaceae bacterium]
MTTPSEVASERDVLLATKLHMPRPRPDLVPRPRLAERLDEGLARGVMLVCAPAGYGKTVLLADWARRGPQPVAWLSLDVGDNDPARFWRHGVAALDRSRPGLAERVGPLLGPPAPASYEGLVTALINELAAGSDAVQALLVLDDYHLIDSEAVHTSLGFLLEHRPPGLNLVLASRSDPPLALARLRGRGQLTELRAAELRFTADEAAALLRQGRRSRAWPCRKRRWRPWPPGPRAGPPGCSWRPCRCAGSPMPPGSRPRSPAATASSWTSWPKRSSSTKVRRYARSCWRPRCSSGSAARCVTPSPAGLTARRC